MKYLTYAKLVTKALVWVAILKVACVCSKEIRQANAAGERLDHVDDAFDRLNALHVELFGSEE